MTNPAMPAQPVQPGGTPYQASPDKPDNIIQALLPLLLRAMQPQNPSAAYGGYQTPQVGSGQSQAIPGIPTPIAPTSIPKGTEAPQAYPLANVSGPGPAVPPGPMGPPVIPTPENHEIGSGALQTQYEKLTKQRELLAVPESTEGTYYAPSEDLKDQITGWMGNYVAYATRPQELGGLGMSPFNARIAAQVQARRSFPKINPDDLSAFAQTAGEGSKEVPGRGGVEIGPQRVARELRSPKDLAEVLARNKTQKYIDEARAFRESAGASASAEAFTNHLFSKWTSESAADARDVTQLTKDYELAKAQLELKSTEASQAAKAAKAGETADPDLSAKAEAEVARLALLLDKLEVRHKEQLAKSQAGLTEADMVARLREDAMEISAAAAVTELY